MGTFGFETASQFVERYHSAVSYPLSMDSLISKDFCKFSK
jgi:hypothetical protein